MKVDMFATIACRGAAVFGLSLTVALTGCGGSGSSSSTPNTTRTSQKLVFSNFEAATVEIGQTDFSGTSSNRGSTADANTLSTPYGNPLVSTNGMTFIGDWGNNRVLGFNTLPTVNNANANFALGQPDFTTVSAATTQAGMNGPQQISVADGKMLVSDYTNNRVLIYNSIPMGGTAVPDVVLGQPDFTTNDTTCDASHFNNVETVEGTVDGKVIVTDSLHNRVLIWNSVPTVNGQAPDLVLGQGDLTHCAANDDNQDAITDATPSQRQGTEY